MIKLIIFDLDNTALDDNKKLDSNLKNTLLKLQKDKDIKYTIASGRSEDIMNNYVDELDLHLPYITDNGACIYQNHKCLDTYCFDSKNNNYILNLLYKNSFAFRVLALEGRYGFGHTPFFDDKAQFIKKELNIYDKDYNYNQIHIYKITIDYSNNPDSYLKVKNKIDRLNNVLILQNENNIASISDINISKATALNRICNILNIDIKDTMAFGDNYNDLSMLLNAGIGVAVNNAEIDIKKQVDCITKFDNNHNAISNFLKEYFY